MITEIKLEIDEGFIKMAHKAGLTYQEYILMCHNAFCEHEKTKQHVDKLVSGLLSENQALKQKLSDAEETIEVMQGGVGHGE